MTVDWNCCQSHARRKLLRSTSVHLFPWSSVLVTVVILSRNYPTQLVVQRYSYMYIDWLRVNSIVSIQRPFSYVAQVHSCHYVVRSIREVCHPIIHFFVTFTFGLQEIDIFFDVTRDEKVETALSKMQIWRNIIITSWIESVIRWVNLVSGRK